VSLEPEFPEHPADVISQTAMAKSNTLDIDTVPVRAPRSGPIPSRGDGVVQGRELAECLSIPPRSAVISWSRIRRICGKRTRHRWIPALAECSYFVRGRLPNPVEFCDQLEKNRINSICAYFASAKTPIRSSGYRLRVSDLPRMFSAAWSDLGGASHSRWLRIESTNYTAKGAVQESIAFIPEGLVELTATQLSIAFALNPRRGGGERAVPCQRRPPDVT
jgi:hypothetical protein